MNSTAVADRVKELEEKHTAEQVAATVAAIGVSGAGEESEHSEGASVKVMDLGLWFITRHSSYVMGYACGYGEELLVALVSVTVVAKINIGNITRSISV